MAVNLPPHYHDAEARYKKAQTSEDKLVALKEMWVLLPKHKASEKVQADLKTKISELTDQIEHAKTAPKKAAHGSFKFPRQGAGQVVFLGPPNAGKSLLMTKLTKATPAVAPYPFTTREPVPGMNCHSPEAAAHERAVGRQALTTCPSQTISSGTPSSRKILRAICMY